VVNWKELSNKTNYNEYTAHGFHSYPVVLIQNETIIPKYNITYENVATILDQYIAELDVNIPYDEAIIDIPFIGRFNTSSLSLPVLTIVLGALDSFNPCSFFILLILLDLLLYLQSRRRMLLVGGIFVFFSGFFYFLFMFVLYGSILLIMTYISIISIIIGTVALIVGLLNMKDFFFFKKGPTLSISEEKREKTFQRMRRLVKAPSLLAMLGGTIFLAVSVNFFELVCTFGFPMLFTSRLATAHLSAVTSGLYIFFYNVVYVIPLIIIVLLFTFTLGTTKLTEWQGRVLKLLPGLVIFSIGLFFIIDYTLLENVFTILAVFVVNIVLTVVIAFIWKKYKEKPGEIHGKENT
jgi:hypothetical protein